MTGTFRNTIEHDTFANHAITIFGEHAREKLLKPNLGLYLYHRSKMPLDSHTSLPTKINQMVSFVAEELSLISHQQLDTARQALTQCTCIFPPFQLLPPLNKTPLSQTFLTNYSSNRSTSPRQTQLTALNRALVAFELQHGSPGSPARAP